MEATQASKGGLRVAVTGAAGDMGRLLLPLLERDPDVESILVLDVATSVRGIADQLEKNAGKGGLTFLDYQGTELPW